MNTFCIRTWIISFKFTDRLYTSAYDSPLIVGFAILYDGFYILHGVVLSPAKKRLSATREPL